MEAGSTLQHGYCIISIILIIIIITITIVLLSLLLLLVLLIYDTNIMVIIIAHTLFIITITNIIIIIIIINSLLRPNLPTDHIPTKIACLILSGKFLMGLEIPPLELKIPLESKPLKSRILVRLPWLQSAGPMNYASTHRDVF